MRGGLEIPILVRNDVYYTRPQVYVSHPETEHLPDLGTGEGQDCEDYSEMAQCLRRLVLLEGMPDDRRDLLLCQEDPTVENSGVSTHVNVGALVSHWGISR